MNKALVFISLVSLIPCMQSCGKLSREAKAIAGSYVIPEVSNTLPVMELDSDASCLVRAIRPGVITYTVRGQWNVENDSLIMVLDRSTLEVDGDASLVGDIPVRYARKIVEYSDLSLELESDGIQYYYKRVNQN